MKTIIVGTLFAVAASSAAAQEIMAFDDHFVSQKTRAEVMAEVRQAQADGVVQTRGEITLFAPVATGVNRSRDEVRAEGRQAAVVNAGNTLYDKRYRN